VPGTNCIASTTSGAYGAFWEGRFKSVAVLDEASLLATAYIDLNPLAAGAAPSPEESDHTSLRVRLDHCQTNGSDHALRDDLSTLTRNPAQEVGLWLLPLDDTRVNGGDRPGLMAGCTLYRLAAKRVSTRPTTRGEFGIGGAAGRTPVRPCAQEANGACPRLDGFVADPDTEVDHARS
jgi:hypothetical protein